jgi:hypothetical protein
MPVFWASLEALNWCFLSSALMLEANVVFISSILAYRCYSLRLYGGVQGKLQVFSMY